MPLHELLLLFSVADTVHTVVSVFGDRKHQATLPLVVLKRGSLLRNAPKTPVVAAAVVMARVITITKKKKENDI